jgi:hypothetical protein
MHGAEIPEHSQGEKNFRMCNRERKHESLLCMSELLILGVKTIDFPRVVRLSHSLQNFRNYLLLRPKCRKEKRNDS